MKKIAMIGATGMLGLPVAAELLNAGFEVTALVRDPARAKGALPSQVTLIQADVRDVESLKRGLLGQDALYLNLSVGPGEAAHDFHTEAEGLDNILAAAGAAGVKRVGYLSAMIQECPSNGWWVLELWKNAVAKIKQSGIDHTIFYPTNFMETLPQKHVHGRVLTLIGTARHPNYWISGHDYGKQVAAAFALPSAANRDYVIQGPEALTYDEAARRYARAVTPHLFVTKVPLVAYKALGLLSRPIWLGAKIIEAILAYPEEFRAAETWRELGYPTTTIEAFARNMGTNPAAA